jgi:hypothetical protein
MKRNQQGRTLFLYLSRKHWCVSKTATEMHMQHSLQCRKASTPPTRQKPHKSQWNGFFDIDIHRLQTLQWYSPNTVWQFVHWLL